MTRKAYPSDLNDAEWGDIKDLLPPASKIGSPRTVDLREIIDAIFYLVDNGIKWRAMPHDFPPWSTVYTTFVVGHAMDCGLKLTQSCMLRFDYNRVVRLSRV